MSVVSSHRCLPLLAVFLLVAEGCATLKKPELDDLKPAVEAFHQRVRWKDFRGAADLIVPERRDTFVKARAKTNDERDLFITDYQLEDARLAPDMSIAKAVTRLSWYRLPSSSEQTVTVTSVFVWRDNTWLLESQDVGPFPELKPAPEKSAAPVPAPVPVQ